MSNALTIHEFNPRDASEREYAAAHRMSNRMRAESEPDDPPRSLEEETQGWKNIPNFVDVKVWGIWNADGSELIATASAAVLRLEQNQHMAEFEVGVLPEYRRRGIARRLLALCADFACRENRRLMMTGTISTVPAGEAFVRRIGGELGLSMHTNQLVLDRLDRALVAQWLARGEQNAGEFELGWWDGPYPDADLSTMADFMQVMNSQPRENLDMEDWNMTPEHLREFERGMAARGVCRWTLFVRERRTGRLVGYSEVTWHPSRPQILEQGGTGVREEYRNRGLGRWLKAAMLDMVLRELPAARFVRTGNAFSNAPMLKINDELGFAPYCSRYQWQVETEKVLQYLGEKSYEHAGAEPAGD